MSSGVYSDVVYSTFSKKLYLSSYCLKWIVNELVMVFVLNKIYAVAISDEDSFRNKY